MNTKNQLIASGIISVIGIMTAITMMQMQIQAQAQVEPTQRFFQKDYCVTEKTLFDDISYASPQDPLSYNIVDCPTTNIVINRWNELTTGERTIITARLTTLGYEDVTTQIQLAN